MKTITLHLLSLVVWAAAALAGDGEMGLKFYVVHTASFQGSRKIVEPSKGEVLYVTEKPQLVIPLLKSLRVDPPAPWTRLDENHEIVERGKTPWGVSVTFFPDEWKPFQTLMNANVGHRIAIMVGDIVCAVPLLKTEIQGEQEQNPGISISVGGENEAQKLKAMLIELAPQE